MFVVWDFFVIFWVVIVIRSFYIVLSFLGRWVVLSF